MTYLHELKQFLSTPLQLGKLCDWGLVFGAFFGIAALLFSVLISKDRKSINGSLAVMVAASLLILPAEHFHKTAGPVPTARVAAMQSFRATRQHNAWMFYVQAALAGLALPLAGRPESGGAWWLLAALLGAFITGSVALWTQLKECQLLTTG